MPNDTTQALCSRDTRRDAGVDVVNAVRCLLTAKASTLAGSDRDAVNAVLHTVLPQLHSDTSGHDGWHVFRVMRMSIYLGGLYGADQFILMMAAMLHDVAHASLASADDYSIHHLESARSAQHLLQSANVSPDRIAGIVAAITQAETLTDRQPTCSTLESKIQYDADRLDAIGAVGIARAFMFGGKHALVMHDPSVAARLSYDATLPSTTVINHFREKLIHLDSGYFMPESERIARGRARIVRQFLDQFLAEWDLSELPPSAI